MTRRLFLATLLGLALAGAAPSAAEAGYYTVYYYNFSQLGYRFPIPYSRIYRTGATGSVYTTLQNCIRSINARVAQNKRYGTDWEGFLIVYTDRYPTTPRNTEIGTLAHVYARSYGRWAAWWVYHAPARGRGYYLNPPITIKPYG